MQVEFNQDKFVSYLEKKKTKWVKHIHKEGSRNHVIYWDTNGRHCIEENCEINKPEKRRPCK